MVPPQLLEATPVALKPESHPVRPKPARRRQRAARRQTSELSRGAAIARDILQTAVRSGTDTHHDAVYGIRPTMAVIFLTVRPKRMDFAEVYAGRDMAHSDVKAGHRGAAGIALAGLAALGSVLAASSCCLPILPFVMAAGFAGGSAILDAARPYLLGASVAFIALGFWQARRAKACRRKPRIAATALLWISTLVVVVSILFPAAMANAAADLFSR